MRMLDEETNANIQRILIMLTREEIENLGRHLQDLLKQGPGGHSHFPSGLDYQKEITLGYYDSSDLTGFNDRVRKLIETDT
jgi:hypothetical protein